ncbi:ureidoglycolate lyase [Geminicoccaceae bacterium 1502E]|nr:ureidoglycolate lyase [Geminicoccaceae bacterium 1502E]
MLRARPLAADAFAPFGAVIEAGGGPGIPVNAGTAVRLDQRAGFGHATGSALPILAVYRCQPQVPPLEVPLVERHPFSSQTFLPMGPGRYLVVVLPSLPGGAPDPAGAMAFLASGRQGVTYAASTWHSPMIALDRESDFAMLMWESGSGDTEIFPLDRPLDVMP